VSPPGCSSAGGDSGGTTDAEDRGDNEADAALDSRAVIDTAVREDAAGETSFDGREDASTTETSADARHDPKGDCPACQAGKCRTELEACAGSSACVDWLVCMNECFKNADVTGCQTGCRVGMVPAAKRMDDCTEAKCHAECTP
jgi:hypothetical protein